ncbi:MAG: thioredoxin family protein [Planctomycetes bacterium]|nr:thioredoxin family protein [Planctomycetota bacterium]NOG55935.1 thioredoxin family protein [Planctomycetota bacterium]
MTRIQILGTGCPKCQTLFENARTAANQSGVECELEKVTDLSEIMKYGVMMTPALVINGQVVSSGKIPDPQEIGNMLVEHESRTEGEP